VFTNTFWSAEGNMLLLFPDGFWYDAATYIVIGNCRIGGNTGRFILDLPGKPQNKRPVTPALNGASGLPLRSSH